MTQFVFDDYVRATMGGATNVADGSRLSPQQIEQVAAYLKSPRSGVGAAASFEQFVARNMAANPPSLPAGQDYVGFSGTDSFGDSNFENALEYTKDLGGGGKAGIIGNTQWGAFIEATGASPDFRGMRDKFADFLVHEGIEPYGKNPGGALQDMMWNAGSSPYIHNAMTSGRPFVGFVENAPQGRGFSNFELPTAQQYPDARMNGRAVSTFGPDPLASASQSAAEFQQLERALAASATMHGGREVTVADLRGQVYIASGYDAANKTVFGQPLDDFHRLNLDQMSAASKAWSAQEASRVAQAHPSEPAEHARAQVLERSAPRGPPGVEGVNPSNVDIAAHPRSAIEVEAGAAGRAGPSLAARGLGYVGAAAVVYDGAKTFQHTSDLLHAGNVTGGQSEVLHFASRNLGMLAGAEVVGGAAALAGVESGPGLLVFGAVGAVAGAVGGDKVANAIDNHRIYNQDDSQGKSWHYDAAHPEQGWTRTEMMMKTATNGAPYFEHEQRTADAALTHTLNYKASSTAVDLALAHTNTPKDPYSQPAGPHDTRSVQDAPWVRDPQSHAWSRVVTDQVLEHGLMSSHTETANPARAAQLEQSANATITANLADSPKGIAQHYLDGYQRNGWQAEGAVPASVTLTLKQPNNVREASDGDTYTRGADGHWRTPGTLYGTNEAKGNIRDELNATQQAAQHASAASAGDVSAVHGLSRDKSAQSTEHQEAAKAAAAMHGGDAAARGQAAKIVADEQKVARPGEQQPEHDAAAQIQARQDALRAHTTISQANLREQQAGQTSHQTDHAAQHHAQVHQAAQTYAADHVQMTADATRQVVQQQQPQERAQTRQDRDASARQDARAVESERQRDYSRQDTRERHDERSQQQGRQETNAKAAEAHRAADKPTGPVQPDPHARVSHTSGNPSVPIDAVAQAVRIAGTAEHRSSTSTDEHSVLGHGKPKGPAEQAVHSAPAIAEHQAHHVSERVSKVNVREEPDATQRHSNPAHVPGVAEPKSQRLDDPAHPDHAFYGQVREKVRQLDRELGRAPDHHTDQVASALTVQARADGLHRVDQVALGEGGKELWAVQTPMGRADHLFDQRTSVPTASANMPMEQSAAQWPQAMQQFHQSQQQAQAHAQAQIQTQAQAQQQAIQGPAVIR